MLGIQEYLGKFQVMELFAFRVFDMQVLSHCHANGVAVSLNSFKEQKMHLRMIIAAVL